MTARAALRLGRVSNLPTVWTNVLAGAVIAGAGLSDARVGLVLAAASLLYLGGMFLNDWCDREIDARERGARPIPAGDASARAVLIAGACMLVLAVGLLALAGLALTDGAGWWPIGAGLALVAAILLYDVRHKQTPWAPLVMAACRWLVYIVAAAAVVGAPPALAVGAGALLAVHIVGLTAIAAQENLRRLENAWPVLMLAIPVVAAIVTGLVTNALAILFAAAFGGAVAVGVWLLRRRASGDIGLAVTTLIAAIALLDAALIAAAGDAPLAWLAGGCFLLTVALQRLVPGT